MGFRNGFTRLFAGLVLLLGSMTTPALAAGLMTPTNSGLPPLQIREQHVTVDVEDGYAITEVEQVFHNPNDQDLEAYYRFPVPERGTVAEFTVWIDGKPVIGEVLEKQQARQVYEKEKAAGREAGLTEKDSYKAFDVRVQPVRAGQDTRVRLVYMQPAFVDTGIGRYVYPLEEGGVDEIVLAMNATLEGQTTAHYLAERLDAFPVRITQLAHGLPVGGELDYLDEGTLAQALRARRPMG